MCFVFIREQRATCATYSINWLVFITEMKSVYSAVRTWSLNKAVCVSSVNGFRETRVRAHTTDNCEKLIALFTLTYNISPHNSIKASIVKVVYLCHFKYQLLTLLIQPVPRANIGSPISCIEKLLLKQIRKTFAKVVFEHRRVCPSIIPNWTGRLLPKDFSWNFAFSTFTKICPHIPILVKIRTRQCIRDILAVMTINRCHFSL